MNHTFNTGRIKDKMRERGENQKSLSAKASISRNTLRKALSGDPVRKSVADSIASALGAPLDALKGSAALTVSERRKALQDAGLHELRVTLPSRAMLNFQIVAQRYGVNGGAKTSHAAAQKSATLDLGVTRATRGRPGSSALHIAGGCLAALAPQGQYGEDCIRQFWWNCACGFAPGDSSRRSSRGC